MICSAHVEEMYSLIVEEKVIPRIDFTLCQGQLGYSIQDSLSGAMSCSLIPGSTRPLP